MKEVCSTSPSLGRSISLSVCLSLSICLSVCLSVSKGGWPLSRDVNNTRSIRAMHYEKNTVKRRHLFPWHYDRDNSLASEEEDLFEREREQSPGCKGSSRQPLFANVSAGTWLVDEVKTLVEFVLYLN